MNKKINNLENIYADFFQEMKIDKKSGIVAGSHKRFAAKAAIGKYYFTSPKKILFISLDIGSDEFSAFNRFQTIDERTASVCAEEISGKNPHMAGVYGIALYLLKDEKGWEDQWKILDEDTRFFREILNSNSSRLPREVLSQISLINFYNFVEVGRHDRTGNTDRKFISQELELKFNTEIIHALEPDIIVVHGKGIHSMFVNRVLPKISKNCDVYLAIHPSAIGRNIHLRNPRKYIEDMNLRKIKHEIK